MSPTHHLTQRRVARAAVAAAGLACAVAAGAASADGASALPGGTDYGAGLSLEQITELSSVLERPEDFEGRRVLVRGRVSDVCQKKGCWTVLSQGDDTIRVRFKDYGFFLPKDCSGSQAYAEGQVVVETLSEKTARHYAEESKHGDPDAIHGPQRQVGFVASGVRLVAND